MSSNIPGNTSTTANLTIGTSTSGSLNFAGDRDWYRVSLKVGFSYQIWVEGASSGMGTLVDPYLAIYNSDGVFQHANNDYSFYTLDAYVTTIPNGSGTFYISAEEYGNNGVGSYRVTAWLDQLASTESAATIEPNSVVTDRIGWQWDASDWYKITLMAGVNYQFDLVGSARDGADLALVDGWLALRASNGAALVVDDDSGVGVNARIFFTPSVSGTYYLDVQESGSDAFGVYSLVVNQSPVNSALVLGSVVSGAIGFVGDTNHYALTLAAGVTYGFSVNGGTLADPFLEILDQAGRVLSFDDDSGEGLNSRLTYTPAVSGTYYLAARASGLSGTGTYTASAWALPVVSIADAAVAEGNADTRSLGFVVSLSAPSPVDVRLTAGTRADTASTASGDYQGVWETALVIPAGTTSVTFSIPVNGDQLFEPNEGLRVVLSDADMALIGDGEARGWIIDDDAPYSLPQDPLLRLQWYLYPATGVNIFPVWADYTGNGVRVAVFDQGIDAGHPDIDGNLLISMGRKASNLSIGGAPTLPTDNHGMMVAGVIGAELNGEGIVGVAYDADLISIYSQNTLDEIPNALTYAQNFDILNNSWGFAPQGYTYPWQNWAFADNFLNASFASAGAALTDLALKGRGGLGTVVVQSAGNSFGYGDDTNLHNFQNSQYIITVAATDYSGNVTSYSSPGASILIAAPGGGGVDILSDIITTDGVGASGEDVGDYASTRGTSFSAPVVSGISALMLDANPDLGYRDVQEILAYSAREIGFESNDWEYNGAINWNGGGLHYDALSHDLGYGLVDALAAVRLAETWSTTPRTVVNREQITTTHTASKIIPDGGGINAVSGAFDAISVTQSIDVERAEVTLNVTHPYVGDLSVLLTSPSGTTSFLLWRPQQNALSAYGTNQDNIHFTFDTVLDWGESSVGTWTLGIYDNAYSDVGTFDSWTLNLIGKPTTVDNTYIYTNEFAESVADQAGRATLTDTSGTDTLNAAAVTGVMTIDLSPGGVCTIDGRSLTIAYSTMIENAFGGDGGDVLRGNSAGNVLNGMRGDDTLEGGEGNDSINGGDGADTVLFTGSRNSYTVSWSTSASAFTVISPVEGADILTGIETLKFSDATYSASTLQKNTAPTLTRVSTLAGATEDTAYTITWAALAAAADESDAQGDAIAFRVQALSSGTLTKNGTAVTPGSTVVAEGESLVWTPAANANGILAAFQLRAVDGGMASESDVLVGVTVGAVNDAPTGNVTISGSATQGQTLTAANTLADVDGLGAISYQWKANGTAISGATSSTYTLSQAEVGKTITVVASYTDGQGTAESKTSAATAAVTNVNDAPTGYVTISSAATQGQTLTVANTLADVDGLGTISYQWKADGTSINGATGSSYTLTQAEVGKTVTVTASYTDGQGAAESKTSAATAAVANVNDAPTGTVTISGTATQGQTLTAANTLADADGLGTISYQWYAGADAISGVASSTLTLAEAQVGKAISVKASYTDGHGTAESAASSATAAVANVNDSPTGTVTISGTATQGQTLTASNSLADADGLGTISHQWKAGGTSISGATGNTYTLTQAEVGKSITVVASYTDGQGTAESKTSAATAAVTQAINIITGSSATETLTGSLGADAIDAGAGNDLIRGLGGSDNLRGGDGTDTAVYAGTADQYAIRIDRAARTATVTDSQPERDGTDELTGVERVQLGDQTFDLFNLPRTEAPRHSVSRTFLFDAAYYLLSNPELVPTVSLQTAAQHYLSTGAAEGLQPNMWFDPDYYASRWDDLAPLNLTPDILFLHYNLYGVWEGRSAGPMFDRYDGNRYLTENPDVAAYVDAHVADFLGSRSNGAIAHYVIYGADEGRVAYDLDGNQLETAVLVGVTTG